MEAMRFPGLIMATSRHIYTVLAGDRWTLGEKVD